MQAFNPTKYKLPEQQKVNMRVTKQNVGIFLSAYLSARVKCQLPREPKITSTFSVVPPTFTNQPHSSTEKTVLDNLEAEEELMRLHELFVRGIAAIQHPFKPYMTERRKKVFLERYLWGKSVANVAMAHHISEDTVINDSSEAMIQFAAALDLVTLL